MATVAAARGESRSRLGDPAYQAFSILRIGFTVAPILFGLDKFAHVLVNWDKYLAPRIDRIVPGTAHQAMYVVGVIEVLAGILVAVAPWIGGYVVAAWLAGIITNLLLIPGYYDIALRDFGLLLGALTLARLAWAYRPSRTKPERRREGAGPPAGADVTTVPPATAAETQGWAGTATPAAAPPPPEFEPEPVAATAPARGLPVEETASPDGEVPASPSSDPVTAEQAARLRARVAARRMSSGPAGGRPPRSGPGGGRRTHGRAERQRAEAGP